MKQICVLNGSDGKILYGAKDREVPWARRIPATGERRVRSLSLGAAIAAPEGIAVDGAWRCQHLLVAQSYHGINARCPPRRKPA